MIVKAIEDQHESIVPNLGDQQSKPKIDLTKARYTEKIEVTNNTNQMIEFPNKDQR